jgi:hypothetical protein
VCHPIAEIGTGSVGHDILVPVRGGEGISVRGLDGTGESDRDPVSGGKQVEGAHDHHRGFPIQLGRGVDLGEASNGEACFEIPHLYRAVAERLALAG